MVLYTQIISSKCPRLSMRGESKKSKKPSTWFVHAPLYIIYVMGHLNSTVFSSFRAVPLHYHTFVFYLSIVKERMRRLPTFWGFFSRSSSAASEDVCLLLRKEAPSYLRTQYISSNVSLQM